jgi:protein phosphatase
MKVEAGAYSSKGPVRDHNEDSFLIGTDGGGGGLEDSTAVFAGDVKKPLFFLVADGMGGHSAGDAASAFVVAEMRHAASERDGAFDVETLTEVITGIHNRLMVEGRRAGTPNMGSTLTGIVVQTGDEGERAGGYFNVGDSRVYRLRKGHLEQISSDDSLAALVPGAPSNIILNALGGGVKKMTVASRFGPAFAKEGDLFFMCSDGVHGFLHDDALEQLLLRPLPAIEHARSVIEQVIAKNTDDNCTAVVVKILE